MGSHSPTLTSCTSSLLPLLSSLWPPLLVPQPMVLPPHTTQPLPLTRRRSFPLSHSPMSMEWPMTTPRLTSRRPRPRMLRARLLALSPLLFLMAESRPPPTLLTTTMDLLLRLPMRVPLSTHQSPRKDTDTLLPSTRPLLLPSLLQLTMPKNLN